MTLRKLTPLLLVLTLLPACGDDPAGASGPPEIAYGRDICVECGMIIEESRFAAAYTIEGTEKKFDDIGGMMIHGHETGEIGSATVWVHDYDTEEWIDAHVAFFVHGDGVRSPMGHGVAAFAERDRAEAFAHQHGAMLVDWQGLLALPVEDGRLHHTHEDAGEGAGQDHDH